MEVQGYACKKLKNNDGRAVISYLSAKDDARFVESMIDKYTAIDVYHYSGSTIVITEDRDDSSESDLKIYSDLESTSKRLLGEFECAILESMITT